ncbi:MAG: permease [Candidatus Eisenbacteria bacterium]
MKERHKLALAFVLFLVCWFLPADRFGGEGPVGESLALVRWYAREHVILCLVPAFFIAGAISVFVRQGAVLKCLGPAAPMLVAYPVAAVSGTVLAVCSCTVLPLFAGIYARGAGIGPASAFLYSGPAINVLAIILTARILGAGIGAARAVGAVLFAVLIGLVMQILFRKSEKTRAAATAPEETRRRTLAQDGVAIAAMVGFLVFANWGRPSGEENGLWAAIHSAKWIVAGGFLAVTIIALLRWFDGDELREWIDGSWMFAKKILPLLLVGVVVAGFLLGGPEGGRGLIPRSWIERAVGGNGSGANFFASIAGAFMYFATLTEVPILEGLRASGMGDGPSLALLLAGPAVSLPNMLVIRSVIGTKKTVAYVGAVTIFSAIAGLLFGAFS